MSDITAEQVNYQADSFEGLNEALVSVLRLLGPRRRSQLETTEAQAKATRRKKRQKLDFEEGKKAAAKWIPNARLPEIRAVSLSSRMNYSFLVSDDCDHFPEHLRGLFAGWGSSFAAGFFETVVNHWDVASHFYQFRMHSLGVADGKRWAATTDSELLAKLRNKSAGSYCSFSPMCDRKDITAAFTFIEVLFFDDHDWNDDFDDKLVMAKYREFWRPVVEQSIPDELPSTWMTDFSPIGRLADEAYVCGFIDGALGICESDSNHTTASDD